jgi:hypothetical protein
MTGPAKLRRLVVPLLAASVLLQGMLGLAPHTHDDQVAAGAAAADEHRCSPDRPEVIPLPEQTSGIACLACVVTSVAFDRADVSLRLGTLSSSPTVAVLLAEDLSTPRLWQRPLRGPPIPV